MGEVTPTYDIPPILIFFLNVDSPILLDFRTFGPPFSIKPPPSPPLFGTREYSPDFIKGVGETKANFGFFQLPPGP